MKRIQCIIFLIIMFSTNVWLQGAFLQQLVEAQEARGIRVTTPEDLQFKKQTENLSMQLAMVPQMTDISQDNAERIGEMLGSFYILFFDPVCIRFSTKDVMNDFFEQLKNWHEVLKKKKVIIPWLSGANGLELKKLLVQALKEICLFGRYTKHREENLVTFKLRLQYILTSIMMDSDLGPWKDQLISNNEQLSLGAFYSWEVDLIKAELKDSAALTPLFNKLSATIDKDTEQKAAQRHQQELALEKQQIAERKQKDVQTLQNIVLNIQQQSPTDVAGRGFLYLDCVRVLLDPAYMDLPPADRKAIDNINNQFKNLHTIIGRTFIPILSQEGIDKLKFLVAKSLETISSPLAGKAGGVAFKNHIEFVLKTLMTITPNQTPTENQIKFQWIKPLYFDNQFLTGDLKKKCLDKFNSQDLQKWQAGIRNFTLKIAPVVSSVSVPTPIVSPVVPVQTPVVEKIPEKIQAPEEIVETFILPDIRKRPRVTQEVQSVQQKMVTPKEVVTEQVPEEIVETLPLPKTMQQKRREAQEAERVAAANKRAAEEQATAANKRAAEERATAANKRAAEERVAATKRAADVERKAAEEAQKTTIAQKKASAAPVVTPPAKAPVITPVTTPVTTPATSSIDLRQVSKNLIAQSLVASASTIKNILMSVSPNQKFDLIRMTDNSQYTALHQAASLGRADVIKMLLEGLNQDQRFAVVKLRENDGQTALYLAAAAKSAPSKGFKPADAVKELLEGLTLQQQVELINIPDNDGLTALDIAQSSNNKTIITMLKDILQKGRK